MKSIILNCICNDKPSKIELIQGEIDLEFRVGKMKKFDNITLIFVSGDIITFQGLFLRDKKRIVEVKISEINKIFNLFKVRVLKSFGYGSTYLDRNLTDLKVASKGSEIFYKVMKSRVSARPSKNTKN